MSLNKNFGDNQGNTGEKVKDYTEDLSHSFPEGSALEAITFHYKIRPNHGAPSSIEVENGDMDKQRFWDKMHTVVRDLNKVPDAHEVLPSELKSGGDWKYRDPNGEAVDFDYPNFRGSHVLAGGDNAYVDSIAAENAVPVLSRFIFGLKERNVLSAEEAADAFDDLFSQIQDVHTDLGLDPVSTRRNADGEYGAAVMGATDHDEAYGL